MVDPKPRQGSKKPDVNRRDEIRLLNAKTCFAKSSRRLESRGAFGLMIKTTIADAKFSPGRLTARVIGSVLIISGFIHMTLWAIEGSAWSGPLSLRKPILFGLSGGVTVLSVAWVFGKLRKIWGDEWISCAFGVAMLVEVGLITIQQWRGVPSHFNRATTLDAAILIGMEAMISFASLVIVYVMVRCFRPLHAEPDVALAIRGGMLLLALSCAIGFGLVFFGHQQISLGKNPELYGQSGVVKFPHGMPMHAIQFLPALAWLLRKVRVDSDRRYREVAYGLSAIVGMTCFSLMQTLSGRARFDLTPSSAVVFGVSTLLLSKPLLTLLLSCSRIFVRSLLSPTDESLRTTT